MRILTILLAGLMAIAISGCASSPSTSTGAGAPEKFSKLLVVGIAGDYESRAQFERAVVSELRRLGVAASTYHSIVGGNKPVTRDDVVGAVNQHEFDAVLATRRLDVAVDIQETESRTDTDATTKGGNIVNLFRSDYTDYTSPGSVSFATSATLAVELYSAATQEIVYSFVHETRSEANVGLLIDETASTIVKRIDRQHLIAN